MAAGSFTPKVAVGEIDATNTTNYEAMLTCAADEALMVSSVVCQNKDGSTRVIEIAHNDGSTRRLIDGASLGAGGLRNFNSGARVNLEEGHSIDIRSTTTIGAAPAAVTYVVNYGHYTTA